MGGGTTNFTSINLAGTIQKKVQSTDDILKQIESTITGNQEDKFKQEELSQRILGRISQHEAAFGDKNLPRQRLPKMDPMLLDRYNAARRNVLVLGAIKQAAGSKPSTHRSGKSCIVPSVKDHLDGASSVPDELSTARDDRDRGLHSSLMSFNGSTCGSPDRTAHDRDIAAEPSGLLGAEASQTSISSRRIRHQMSGRSAASSFAGSFAASSSAGKLRHNNSSLSAGSGHTQRSEATTNFSKHGHFRKTPRKGKCGKNKPGRVTSALAEYSQKDDWMSKTLLKHYLASVIQARWRGYTIRKRWAEQESRLALVEEEKAKHQTEALHQQRIRDLQQKLLARQANQQAQATAAAVAAAAADGQAAGSSSSNVAAVVAEGVIFRSGSGVPCGSGHQFKVGSRGGSAGMRMAAGRVLSAASAGTGKAAIDSASAPNPASGYVDSDSDSGWSDLELEDVASIKFRAVTPPWQKVGQQYCMSQQLKRRTAAATAAATGQVLPEVSSIVEDFAGLGLTWDSTNEDCQTRLQELRHRRICRKLEPVQLSEPAVAAAAASGLLAAAADAAAGSSGQDPVDSAEAVIPSQIVEELLLDRYNTKYARMGVLEKMPGRQRWRKLQRDKQAGVNSFGTTTVTAEIPPVLSAGAIAAAVAETVVSAAAPAEGAAAISSTEAAVEAPPVAAAAGSMDQPYAVKKSAGAAAGRSAGVPTSLPPMKGAA